MRREANTQSNLQQRFRFEAEAAARLQHPHIIHIYEVGLHDGRPFLTMEYVVGGNLAKVIQKHPLSARTAARILETLALAIHYAHQQGIVHRDLKPANILLMPSERQEAIEIDRVSQVGSGFVGKYEPKISDFGLAKQIDSESLRTLPGSTLGTPSYMAPEQAVGDAARIGPSSDIYSLGAILYDMLVGRPPFHAATVIETLHQVKTDDPVSIRSIQPDVPRDLETICLKCLQKDPARRYESAAALAADLNRFLHNRPVLARPSNLWERSVKWSRRHPAIAVMFGSLILGAAGIGWQWYRERFTGPRLSARQRLLSPLKLRSVKNASELRSCFTPTT